MDITTSELMIQSQISALLPSINSLAIEEVKSYIFEMRKQEAQRRNLREAWRCGESLDTSMTIEQEFCLHKDSVIESDLSIESLKAILIKEIKTSISKQLEVQGWMVFGGEVP